MESMIKPVTGLDPSGWLFERPPKLHSLRSAQPPFPSGETSKTVPSPYKPPVFVVPYTFPAASMAKPPFGLQPSVGLVLWNSQTVLVGLKPRNWNTVPQPAPPKPVAPQRWPVPSAANGPIGSTPIGPPVNEAST